MIMIYIIVQYSQFICTRARARQRSISLEILLIVAVRWKIFTAREKPNWIRRRPCDVRLNDEKKRMKQKKNDYYRTKGYDNRAASVSVVCAVYTFIICQRPRRVIVYMCGVCVSWTGAIFEHFFLLQPAFNLFHIILMILPTRAREGFVSFFFSYFSPLCDYNAGVCCR
jgi:hypothetical protein